MTLTKLRASNTSTSPQAWQKPDASLPFSRHQHRSLALRLTKLLPEPDSPFEIDVLRMLLARGYKVTPQVKVGQYRIDLVVEGLRDRLAVECNGEKWHGPEKFEEDMRRQESLERAGWKCWRVRGREFYFDKVKALESLWVHLDELGIEPVRDYQSVE